MTAQVVAQRCSSILPVRTIDFPGVRQSWISQIPTVPAYPNYLKMLNNPLLAIMEEQKRSMEAIRNSLPVNALDLATLQGTSPAVASTKAAIEAFGSTSEVIKRLTQGK